MSFRAAKADEVASATGVFNPGVAVGTIKDFVEGEKNSGGEGVRGRTFDRILQSSIEFQESFTVDAARCFNEIRVRGFAAQMSDGYGADCPGEAG